MQFLRIEEEHMYCSNCGKEMADDARFCPACGASVSSLTPPPQKPSVICVSSVKNSKSRISYILLGIFLGVLGVHNFYAGYGGRGSAQLLITLFLGWLVIPLFIVWIWCIVEICTVRFDAQGVGFDL